MNCPSLLRLAPERVAGLFQRLYPLGTRADPRFMVFHFLRNADDHLEASLWSLRSRLRDVIPFWSEAERDRGCRIELPCGSEVLFLLKPLQSSNGIRAPRPVRFTAEVPAGGECCLNLAIPLGASGRAGAYGEPTRSNVAALPPFLWAADLECDEPRWFWTMRV